MFCRTPRIVAPYARAWRQRQRLPPPSTYTTRTYASSSSITDLTCLPQPGARLHGFTLHRATHVPELELAALHFHHDRTGADYLHVARDDDNNVFSIAFKTNPPDATGVPHILEHVTLCGSEKYPVRDPFFKMLPRSLQNFMNAFTSADYTMYPFATTNAQDFQNLMSVYVDATLHPLLKQSDFVQEGWRVGPENPLQATRVDHGQADLVFKGVVYNEMKGQMSDATYLYYVRFMEHIFPALNNSGGDPRKMTDLTFEQLRNFHRAHYHPSNSKILTYGDQPVEDHLSMLGEQLDRFGKVPVDRDVKLPIELQNGPQSVTVRGPVDPLTPPNAQFKTSTTWLMGDTANIAEAFALRIATSLLLDGYGSPMYRALIESGLGTDFTPNTDYDTSSRTGIFSVGVNGVSEENVPKVKDTIVRTLEDAIRKGFDPHKVDGLLHQLDLGLRHKTATFGLDLMQRLSPGWFNGIDPFDALAWKSIVEHFKAEYAEGKGGYLEKLMEKYVLHDHTLTFTMVPSESYGAEVAAEEAQRLAGKIDETVKHFPSAAEAYEHLRQRERELLEEQEAGRHQSLDSLPTLHVSDIPREKKPVEVRDAVLDPLSQTNVQWRETSTNGLTYFRALCRFDNVPDELRMLVPLFCDSLLRIGTKDQSMEELEDLIKLKTGGVGFGYHATTSPFDIHKAEEGLSLSGYALDGNVSAMYELMRTLLLETNFDGPRARRMIKQLLQTGASGAVDAVAESGHAYARRYAEAGLTPHGRMVEQTSGLTQVQMITSLAAAEEDEETMADLVRKLKSIQAIAVHSLIEQRMRVALTCGADVAAMNEEAVGRFLLAIGAAERTSPTAFQRQELPHQSLQQHGQAPKPHYPSTGGKTFFPFPYQVSYTGLALPTGPYTDPATAPLAILAQLLTHKHLHHEIREKGGAYGAGAYSRGLEGVFGMYSYRDPNPDNSLSIIREAGRWAAERQWTEREVEEAKLSVFQGLDAPVGVDDEGMVRFLSGIDGAMEQRRREWLLDVTGRDVRRAAEGLQADLMTKASLVVLGERKGFVDEAEGWKIRDLGMGSVGAGEEVKVGGLGDERPVGVAAAAASSGVA